MAAADTQSFDAPAPAPEPMPEPQVEAPPADDFSSDIQSVDDTSAGLYNVADDL